MGEGETLPFDARLAENKEVVRGRTTYQEYMRPSP
jgi:hypothetical protein